MKLVIVGSVALDDVTTPYGELNNGLGGSAVYASIAASYFTEPGVVGVVGDDFLDDYVALLKSRSINTTGIEKQPGKTFHWKGYYEGDMNSAHTIDTQLNVFGNFDPKLPKDYLDSPYVFLANIDPSLQLKVLDKINQAKFIMLDTMNFWIDQKKEELLKVVKRVDMVVVNDGEARQLTGEINLVKAAKWIQAQGPKGVMIKKGEHGAIVFWGDEMAIVPAMPLDKVVDPTGAGDTYAGAFIGALAQFDELQTERIHQAAAIGTVLASYVVQDFSVNKSSILQANDINDRLVELKQLVNINLQEIEINN